MGVSMICPPPPQSHPQTQPAVPSQAPNHVALTPLEPLTDAAPYRIRLGGSSWRGDKRLQILQKGVKWKM